MTVEGVTRKVPAPFFGIATQNPAGTAGTQMLPPAQMDRFMICTSMGYPDFASEVEMAKGTGIERRTDHLKSMLNAQLLPCGCVRPVYSCDRPQSQAEHQGAYGWCGKRKRAG